MHSIGIVQNELVADSADDIGMRSGIASRRLLRLGERKEAEVLEVETEKSRLRWNGRRRLGRQSTRRMIHMSAHPRQVAAAAALIKY